MTQENRIVPISGYETKDKKVVAPHSGIRKVGRKKQSAEKSDVTLLKDGASLFAGEKTVSPYTSSRPPVATNLTAALVAQEQIKGLKDDLFALKIPSMGAGIFSGVTGVAAVLGAAPFAIPLVFGAMAGVAYVGFDKLIRRSYYREAASGIEETEQLQSIRSAENTESQQFEQEAKKWNEINDRKNIVKEDVRVGQDEFYSKGTVDEKGFVTVEWNLKKLRGIVKPFVLRIYPNANLSSRGSGKSFDAILVPIHANHSNIQGATFSGMKFVSEFHAENANAQHADFSNTSFGDLPEGKHHSLRNTNLRNANLSGANLSNVDLRGADLTGANVTGTKFPDDLTDVVLSPQQKEAMRR